MPIEMTSHTIIYKLFEKLKTRVKTLKKQNIQPHLAVILVGHDAKSEMYVSSIKQKRAQELDINFTIHKHDENATTETILDTIRSLNDEPGVNGIIVQLPLPAHIDTDRILNSVAKEKDVDALAEGSTFTAPTVCAITALLEAYDIPLEAKKIAIVGKGRLVGSPLMQEFKKRKLDVTACDQSTDKLSDCTYQADILISATGQSNLIKLGMVKDKAVVIDVDSDVDYELVFDKVSYITPQKGGVGPLTVAYLLQNVIVAAQKQHT